jgi:hypothetical protein
MKLLFVKEVLVKINEELKYRENSSLSKIIEH